MDSDRPTFQHSSGVFWYNKLEIYSYPSRHKKNVLFTLLIAVLEILPTYSPYNAVVGVVLSHKWKKYLPIVSGMSEGPHTFSCS